MKEIEIKLTDKEAVYLAHLLCYVLDNLDPQEDDLKLLKILWDKTDNAIGEEVERRLSTDK